MLDATRRPGPPDEVPARAVRAAVRRVPGEATLAALAADEARAARTLAERSLVLVENDGILPLAAGRRRVAVIGPIADSARDLLGDYSHLVHIETLREMHEGSERLRHLGEGDVIAPADELTGRRTILDAIRASLGGRRRPLRPRHRDLTTGPTRRSPRRSRSRVASDVAIVVLGERSGLTDDSTTGEFRDRSSLGLPRPPAGAARGRRRDRDAGRARGRQRPAAGHRMGRRALRARSSSPGCPATPARMRSPTSLTGASNPGGKLPISIPRHVGQVPVTYRHHPTGGHSQPKGDYVDGSVAPLWPFGFGLSYTTFRARPADARPDGAADRRRRARRQRRRRRTPGERARRRGGPAVRAATTRRRSPGPVRELRGFRRVDPRRRASAGP